MMERNQFKIFDAHMHTIGLFLPRTMSLIEYMDQYNIEKAILTTTNKAARPSDYVDKGEKQEEYGDTNNKMLKAFENYKKTMPKGQLDHQDVINLSKKHPDRYYKFFWFNPNMDQDQEDEDYRTLENHFNKGFYGVKLHPVLHLIKVPRDILKLASLLEERNKILFLHSYPKVTFFNGMFTKDIVKLATAFPNLKIIVGHAGYAMEYAMELGMNLKRYENIYFETSCSIPYALFSLIKAVGHERILFGSDSPITNPAQIEIDKISCLPISNEQKQDIFYNNSKKLIQK